MRKIEEKVGHDLFTAPSWPREKCQASRIEWGGNRFYQHGHGDYRRGATWLVEKIVALTGGNARLDSWRADFTDELGGSENFARWMRAVADFGTAMHVVANDIYAGIATAQHIENIALAFAEANALGANATAKAVGQAKKTALAIQAAFDEMQIEALAFEQVVSSASLGISTPIDIVATGLARTKKAAKLEKCLLLLNLKTSENGGKSPHHAWQCAIEKRLFKETFASEIAQFGLPVVVGTLRPTDWRDEPKPAEFINYNDFADAPSTASAIESTATAIRATGGFAPPSGPMEITWDGPLGPNTKVIKVKIF